MKWNGDTITIIIDRGGSCYILLDFANPKASIFLLFRLRQPKSSAFRDIFPYLGHARAHDNDFPVLSIWVMRARMTSYILPVYAVALDFRVFSTISSFDFYRLGSNLISMFIRIFAMFVQKNFVRQRFVTKIRAKMLNVPARRNSRAGIIFGLFAYYICTAKQRREKSLATNIETILRNDAYPKIECIDWQILTFPLRGLG